MTPLAVARAALRAMAEQEPSEGMRKAWDGCHLADPDDHWRAMLAELVKEAERDA